MAFCSNCGNRSDGAFCSKCGTRIVNVTSDGKITVNKSVTENVESVVDNKDEIKYRYVKPAENSHLDVSKNKLSDDMLEKTTVIKPKDGCFDETRVIKPIEKAYAVAVSHEKPVAVNHSNINQSKPDNNMVITPKQHEYHTESDFERPSYKQPSVKHKATAETYDKEDKEKNYTKIALIVVLITLIVVLLTVGTIFLVKYFGGNSNQTQTVYNKGMKTPEYVVETLMTSFENSDMKGVVSLLEGNYVTYFANKYHDGNVDKLIKTMDDNFYFDISDAFESDINFEDCRWEINYIQDADDSVFQKYEQWYHDKCNVDINQVKKASVLIDSNDCKELMNFFVIKTNYGWYLAESLITMHY